MADLRDTLLTSEEQRIAAELMASIDVRTLGGGDTVDRIQGPQRDDLDPGTLMSTVHSGSYVAGEEIGAAPVPANFAGQRYDLDGADIQVDDATQQPDHATRGRTANGGPAEGPQDEDGSSRGAGERRSAAADGEDDGPTDIGTGEEQDGAAGANAGASRRAGDGETLVDETTVETAGIAAANTAAANTIESAGPADPPSQFQPGPFGATPLDTGAFDDVDGDEITIDPPAEQDDVVTQQVEPNFADAPILGTSDASGDEDSAIDLDITAALSDSSETLSITISGVPAGATLSAGTNNGDGTWSLTGADLAGLQITPPADSDADFSLTVTATSTSDSDAASTVETLEVTVSPVADAPLAVGGDVSGNEDSAIALDVTAALTDTDGSETLSVTVSGVPAGASLSAGTDNGDGTWTLSANQLTGLTITPPADSDTDFSLTVTATATDGADTADTSWNIDVTVDGVADAPTLGVTDASGDEDSAIALDISAALSDSSETLSVTVSGVPAGAALSAGTDNGDGSWTLTQAQLTGLTLTPPAGSDADFTLTVTATSADGADTASLSGDIGVTVDAVADAPTLTANDVSGAEDSAIALDITSALGDTDGSESLSVVVSGVPSGASLSAGTDNGDGSWTLTQAQLTGLTLTPPADSDADFTLTVTSTATDGSDTAQTVASLDVTVNAVADAPTLTANDVSGAEDSAIALDITSALGDTDGSESLSITIADVPTGATLSVGTDNGDGTWTLDPGDLAGLTVTPTAGSSDDFTLTVTATGTESENGDTAQTVATLDVTVTTDDIATVDGDQYANKNDQLYGGDGEDLIHGYTKNDKVWGGDGDDTLYGDGGNDVLQGEAGDDILIGGTGNDQLFGGAGNDTLSMGAGNDVAHGEDGSDRLIFAEGEGTHNFFHGGDGGAWTDTIELRDAGGGAPGEGWVLELTQGEQVSSGADHLDLSQDSAGTITMEDGSVLTFDGVEKLTW